MHITIGDPTNDVWPVEIGELKEYLQVEHGSDDQYADSLIRSATRAAENYTSRRFIEQEVTAILDSSESYGVIELPVAPYRSLTSFEWYDQDGNLTTVDSSLYYILGTDPARIVPEGSGWSVVRRYGAIKLVWKAGYGTAAATVPSDIIHAIKMIAYDFWKHQGHADAGIVSSIPVPFPAMVLLNPYRLFL